MKKEVDEDRNKNVPTRYVPPENIGDGFDDGDDDQDFKRLIKGKKCKFTDPGYDWVFGKGAGTLMPVGEYVVLKIFKAVQKWENNRPTDTIEIGAGDKLPDWQGWNAKAPKKEWRMKYNELVGPWDWSYVVYLLHDKTRQVFSYLTSSTGGSIAIRELRESVKITRQIDGDNLFPVVELGNIDFPTEWKLRQRPFFIIKTYRSINGGGSQPQITHERPALPSPTREEEVEGGDIEQVANERDEIEQVIEGRGDVPFDDSAEIVNPVPKKPALKATARKSAESKPKINKRGVQKI